MAVDAQDRVWEQLELCETSRERRRKDAMLWRRWYTLGSADTRAAVNRLRPHLDRLASFLYAPGTLRFSLSLPTAERGAWSEAALSAADELRLRWEESGADLMTASAVEWSLVWGTVVLKVQWSPWGPRLGWINPWDFGVSQEDLPSLGEQDVVTHWYTLSLPKFRFWARRHPNAERLIEAAERHAIAPTPERESSGILPTGVTGTFPNQSFSGVLTGELLEPGEGQADVREPVVQLADVWERALWRRPAAHRKDRPAEFEDWRVTTVMVDARLVVDRRRNPELPWTPLGPDREFAAMLPFVAVVPRPRPDYLWGRSELDDLITLQRWIDRQVLRMRYIARLQANPPKFISGQVIGPLEEVARRLRSPGGIAAAMEPNAALQPLGIALTEEQFRLLDLAERYFAEASGVPELLAGGPVPGGIRAGVQLTQLAGIGATRIRRMALQVEQAVSDLAWRVWVLLQRHDATSHVTPTGQRFLLAQIPASGVHVSAHSASPIFAEQLMAKALALHRAGALSGEDLVDLLDPPNREALKRRARQMAEARAQMAARWMEIQARRRGPGRPPERMPS
jgi:hypothetical protein